jgi:GNAT superfamily N-acetyltransferase
MKIVILKQGVHNRDLFSCGNEELDAYLKRYALQDVRRNLTKVFVLEGKSPEEVVGYYTLSPLSFSKMEMAQPFSKKLPHYPIPAILLGRLAVGLNFQGQDVGAKLLMDALLRIYRVSEDCFGIYAVVVDAKNERASAFYQHFGFIPFLKKTNRLFLPLDVVKSLESSLFPTLHEQVGKEIRHVG